MNRKQFSQDSNGSSKSDVECYDCLYTKDKHKKDTNRVWNDGIFIYNRDTGQMIIYDSIDKDTKVAQQFKKNWVLYDESEIVHFPMCLCTLEAKRDTPHKYIKSIPDIKSVRLKSAPKTNRFLDKFTKKEGKIKVEKLKRKKFKVPEKKKEEAPSGSLHYNSSATKTNYYSYGKPGFKNNHAPLQGSKHRSPTKAPHQKFDEDEMAAFLDDFVNEEEQPEKQKQVKPAATVDQDVNDFFSRVKGVNKKPKFNKTEHVLKQISESDSENSPNSEDEDVQLERKIKMLSGLDSINAKSSKESMIINTIDLPKPKSTVPNPEIKKEKDHKLAEDLADIKLLERRKEGDITCNESCNEGDMLDLLNAGTEQESSKEDNSQDIQTLLGKRRTRDQMETDNLVLPSPTRLEKRANIHFNDEDIEEISRMVNVHSNENLESFERTIIDLQESPLDVENYNDVYRNRRNYSKYYILSLLEMLKYEIEEDFNNKKAREIPIISVSLDSVTKKKKKKGSTFQKKMKKLKKKTEKETKAYSENLQLKSKKQMESRNKTLEKKINAKETGAADPDTDSQEEVQANDEDEEETYEPGTAFKSLTKQKDLPPVTEEAEIQQENTNPDQKDEQKEGDTDSTALANMIKADKEQKKDAETIEQEEDEAEGDIIDHISIDEEDELLNDSQDEDLDEDQEEEKTQSQTDENTTDVFFLNIEEEEYPQALKKNAQKDDMWVLMKTCMNTTQKLKDINDFIFVKTCWHGLGKAKKIKVKVIGNPADIKPRMKEYKFAFRSINVSQYASLVDNLIAFRDGPKNRYLDSVLYINKTTFFEPLIECNRSDVVKMKDYFSQEFSLNRDQRYVMEECIKWFLPKDRSNDAKQNVLLVHGAFGCGKSYMLVAIIRFISALLDHIGDTEIKILVSTLTNVAVDRILLLLLETGFQDFARVGSLQKINKMLLPYSHHASCNNTSRKEALKELDGIRKDLHSLEKKTPKTWEEINSVEATIKSLKEQTVSERREQLRSKRVVGCTLAATTFEVLKKTTFKIVILDECSQMLEPHSLQAIVPFGCEKLIAVGDPLQLPPIVSLGFKDLYDKQKQDDRSLYKPLFVRLQYDQLETILLRVQYRCHPAIGELSNNLFYENELEHGVNAQSRERLLSEFEAINFINADKGVETKSEVSYCNYYEAKFIVALLEYLQTIIENKKIAFLEQGIEEEPDFTIGVIVTYKAQEDLIKRIISETRIESLKHIQISTVDAFQGAERDVIILGCVRTRSLGFMNDYRRLNVAITRAKRHLILVGHEKLLKKNPQWKYIIDNTKVLKKGYKKCEEYLAKAKIFRELLSGM
ncbi:unnamed protein product [Moneuplotes crassus]|uniref:Uncharacterized protein n=1 Tax=Euplotes crassus TaxID=5936 RepID=A0AAD1UH02_EUPCR|nr:unnamed protein product [Moneuplotes crassus]